MGLMVHSLEGIPEDHHREYFIYEKTGDTSAVIRSRVVQARAVQQHRNTTDLGSTINANLTSKQIREHCSLEESSKKLLYKSMESLQLSTRAYERILKVCKTIADLAGSG